VIELVSDLGGGKTTFVKGLVRGSGSTDHVSSPTFTISNIYMTKKLEIHHFDFYRLYEAGLIEHEIVDLINDPKVVIIVEWSDVVKHVLPSERIMVHIKNEGQEKRQLEIKYPDKLAYVMEAFT
jgi:tRNA threonylcarbamoyladenosine biosynthesis protein TsaE